jgi:molybdopterin/thiamine biosynthesis adenylyltransferase
MKLDKTEMERYKKHLQLLQVGQKGQEKLKQASVLVVGAGGLGSPVLLYLTGAGIGHISIIDGDRLELSNLPRQVLHDTSMLGREKVESAREKLRALNPSVALDIHAKRLSRTNAAGIISGHEVVVDCSDNLKTRFLLNEICAEMAIPLVYGAVFQFEGQLSVFDAKNGPCLRCMIRDIPPASSVPDPADHGLLNTVPGVIGMLQATEVLKLVLGIGDPLIGRLLLYDSLSAGMQEIHLKKRPDCPVCGKYISKS